MKEKNFLTKTLVLLIIVVLGLGGYLFINLKSKKAPIVEKKKAATTPIPSVVISVKSDLPIVKKDETSGKEILEIPFEYEVRSVSDREIILGKPGGGERATITYPKQYFSAIKVFLNKKEGTVSGTLADVEVGKYIKVFNINRGEEIRFYIVNP